MFDREAAKPKSPKDQPDPPVQQSMRASSSDKIRRAPSADQKKVRREMSRQGAMDLTHGPSSPGPEQWETGTRWEDVVTAGQGFQVVVLWPGDEAPMLSGVFGGSERADDWGRECYKAGAVSVMIQDPGERPHPLPRTGAAMNQRTAALPTATAGDGAYASDPHNSGIRHDIAPGTTAHAVQAYMTFTGQKVYDWEVDGLSGSWSLGGSWTVNKSAARRTANTEDEYEDLAGWPTAPKTIEAIRAVVTNFSAKMVDGVMLDAQSANAIITVYDALSDANKAKFAALPIERMADVAWKVLTKASSLHSGASGFVPHVYDTVVNDANGDMVGLLPPREDESGQNHTSSTGDRDPEFWLEYLLSLVPTAGGYGSGITGFVENARAAAAQGINTLPFILELVHAANYAPSSFTHDDTRHNMAGAVVDKLIKKQMQNGGQGFWTTASMHTSSLDLADEFDLRPLHARAASAFLAQN